MTGEPEDTPSPPSPAGPADPIAVAAYAIDLAEQLSELARDSGLGALAHDLRQASDTGRSALLEMIRDRLLRH